MRVTIRLHGELTRFLPQGFDRADLDTAEGATVRSVLDQLGLPKEEYWLLAVNGVVAEPETELRAGDMLECVAPISGG